MKRMLILVLATLAMVFATEAPSAQREETFVVVVNAPSKELRNPYQEEYEKLLYPTVRISAGFSTGSGVAIDDYILTAAHVVGNETEVNIEANDKVLTATVVITDTLKDLALLRTSQPLTYKARLAPRDYTPYIFTPIYTVGCSLGLNPRPSQGIISVVDKDHWEITSPVLPGNSGGPVYDGRTYEVIGIAVWVKLYNGRAIPYILSTPLRSNGR